MSMTNTRDGAPSTVVAGNGTPQGPRVRRPGWRGWWLYAPAGTLVPDGHVERVDPNERWARRRAIVEAALDGDCPAGIHDSRQMASNGRRRWCRACGRERSAAAAARRKGTTCAMSTADAP